MDLARPVTARQRAVFAQAMHAAASGGGQRPLRAIEQDSIAAIARWMLEAELPTVDETRGLPGDLEDALADPALRRTLVQVMLVLPLVGGEVDRHGVACVEDAARRLRVQLPELGLLRHAARGRRLRFLWRIVRNAAIDFWGKGGRPRAGAWLQIAEQALVPGRLRNARLAGRYRALACLPPETLGGAIHRFYADNGWALPGEPGGMPDWFVVHECSHILSGYGTTPLGEMLTAVWTAGAKRRNAMDWVLVPLLQWHVGLCVASLRDEATHRGLLQPDAFFSAWRRGMDMRVSLMDDPWSWWDVIQVPVAELRERYNIVPLPAGVPAQ